VWTAEETLAHLRDQGGRMLDPTLVALLLENWDEFLALRDRIVLQSRDVDAGEDEKKS
jgi:response regulator RpfG family c-di-GMP phosphodiesterase